MNLLKEWSNDFLYLVFPHNCTGCGSDVLESDQQLCLHCIENLPSTAFFQQANNPVEQVFYGRLPIRNGAAGYFFTKESLVQQLIVQLKYRGNAKIGTYMGIMLGHLIENGARFNDVDLIIPLPLNPKKEKKRGYNQAALLCRGIAEVFKRPVAESAVTRKVYTETQTHKGRISRWENMDGVFMVSKPDELRNKHILLVDDIVTTGATIEACGAEILRVPGTTLSIATLAYTL